MPPKRYRLVPIEERVCPNLGAGAFDPEETVTQKRRSELIKHYLILVFNKPKSKQYILRSITGSLFCSPPPKTNSREP